jgi:hypothetical protein
MKRMKLFICLLSPMVVIMLFSCWREGSGDALTIKHPIRNPPEFTTRHACDNCRMDRNSFARTRYDFKSSEGDFFVCSLRCVAELSRKLKIEPVDVRVALYLHPERMIKAEDAFYVIGSRARGTMTKVSKLAFESRSEAERFISRYGGMLAGYRDAFSEAKMEMLKNHPPKP